MFNSIAKNLISNSTIKNTPIIILHYLNGEWVKSQSGKYIAVENPATEQIVGYVSDATAQEAQMALETSEKAQLLWQELSVIERAKHIQNIIDCLQEEITHFAEILTKEQGKTYAEALCEVEDTINYMRQAIEGAKRIKGEILPTVNSEESLLINRVPYGVTLGLCTWNYPLALVGRKLAPALITGNTIIIKPHDLTPLATAEFFRIIDKAQIPQGVVNLITSSGIEVSQQLVSSPITKLVNVTGSVGAGQAIYRAAAQNISGLVLELGGKSPFIVLKDADIDKAVEAAVISRYANCGQVCICCDMIFVEESIVEEFTEKLLKRVAQIKVGNPFDSTTNMGPKMCKSDLEKIDGIVQRTLSQGAKLLCGGESPKGAEFEKGYWYEPTVLGDVTPDMAAAQVAAFRSDILTANGDVTPTSWQEVFSLASKYPNSVAIPFVPVHVYSSFFTLASHLNDKPFWSDGSNLDLEVGEHTLDLLIKLLSSVKQYIWKRE
ncbi:MAG: aldehyde dehydrogenase family protein [Rikenellaceae bacterium]